MALPAKTKEVEPSTWNGSRILWWRLRRGSAHQLRQIFIEQPIRGFSMLMVLVIMWLGIGGLTTLVLNYLSQEEFLPLKPRLIHSLLGMFFFALFWLITFSNAIIVWGALLRNESALFQAQLPLKAKSLYWGSAVEGGLFASWAAIVLAIPLLFTLTREAPDALSFFPAALITVSSFLFFCLALGSWASMLLARVVLWVRQHLTISIIIAAVAATSAGLYGLLSVGGGRPDAGFLRQAIAAISFTETPYLPPAWAQEGVSAAMRSHWSEWAWHTMLLLVGGSACAIMGEGVANRRLSSLLSLLCGGGNRRRGPSKVKASHGLWPNFPGLSTPMSLLIRKDLRLFRRDPAQILQFGLYFGLLGVYIVMLPRFDQTFAFDDRWRPVVSLLNLTAVAMALATFTGRFIFPMLGQEGKRLWILALTPWPRSSVVYGKYLFALIIGLPVCVGLVLLSGWLLSLPPQMIAYQGYVAATMASGCSAMSLGIGALLADYREDDAGKVAAGYGGTINLLASLIFITLLLIGAGVPIFAASRWRFEMGIAWTTFISSAWTIGGMYLAVRCFNRARIST